MADEFSALLKNNTWSLVPHPLNVNVVGLNLVVKPITIHTVLALDVMNSWPIHQLDVKNAFLHGHLYEVVYMSQSPGFINSKYPNYVYQLNRALYGLK
ncbi:hypothetical protein SLEP1_g31634 [Rubroshorea leprosula]|uniref:Reverse transcriptase Ty1/copia-type domain-containing protein n=1 Tax=Rubroshorea leprosula TaxID=152421 RepID=A0AAV5KAR0_9ROSI|nr:hypothetical protein SLEP1_g31634 [Rubroshorea leprosula]